MYCICQACSTDSQGGRPSRGRVSGQSFTREINTKVNTEPRIHFCTLIYEKNFEHQFETKIGIIKWEDACFR